MTVPISFLEGYSQFFRKDFLRWLANNNHVYAAFEARAFGEMTWNHQTHFSAHAICYDLRHRTKVRQDDPVYKIDHQQSADMARVFALLHPEHVNFFSYRRHDTKEFKAAVEECK